MATMLHKQNCKAAGKKYHEPAEVEIIGPRVILKGSKGILAEHSLEQVTQWPLKLEALKVYRKVIEEAGGHHHYGPGMYFGGDPEKILIEGEKAVMYLFSEKVAEYDFRGRELQLLSYFTIKKILPS